MNDLTKTVSLSYNHGLTTWVREGNTSMPACQLSHCFDALISNAEKKLTQLV